MTSTTGTSKGAKPIHIFKPGRHTSMAGQDLEFSESIVQAIARVYSPAKHEAPLVVGHPRTDDPAYGWVQGLQFSDGSDDMEPGLWALPAQVNAEFADMVAAGAFKKISAKFYGPSSPNNPTPGQYYLRHVGFLGAQPPAVKGLRSPAFADDEEGSVAFEFAFADAEASPAGSEVSQPPEAQKESTVTEEEAARLRAENEAQAARIAQLEATAQAERTARLHNDNVAFADALIAEGRMAPGAKDVYVATLDHLAGLDTPVEFGEGDSKAPLIDSLKGALKAAPKVVEFGESATRDRAAGAADGTDGTGSQDEDDAAFADSADPERLKQHKAIKAYQAQHKVDYATAARAVLK